MISRRRYFQGCESVLNVSARARSGVEGRSPGSTRVAHKTEYSVGDDARLEFSRRYSLDSKRLVISATACRGETRAVSR
jgi:hypothetical protein